jgi:hypothetical protein
MALSPDICHTFGKKVIFVRSISNKLAIRVNEKNYKEIG